MTHRTSILVDDVTKHYRIYPTPLDRFRDALGLRSSFKDFEALSNVSFRVGSGEFWGILGRNGSGKSTLLKVVAGQLQATKGSVTCNGRAALLQLGLGFDPELTGLENIKHSRLLQNLTSDYHEVVDFVTSFSELGDFINYPVKTYSSGMYSRLAFATAIAGDPDILIADEVLAVGDMNFSQKCLAKMREFKELGKTVVLVTHDITAVKNFCDQAIWLNEGKLIASGPATLVAEDFRNFMLYGVTSSLATEPSARASDDQVLTPLSEPSSPQEAESSWVIPNSNRRTVTTGRIDISRYRFVDLVRQAAVADLQPSEPIGLEIDFSFLDATEIASFGVTLHDRSGNIAVHLNSEFFGGHSIAGAAGRAMRAKFLFDVPPLANGDYSISLGCSDISGNLLEKYDYDSTIGIYHQKSPATDRQGGYVIIPDARFEIS
ncbi:ABC transporter ATP-binding protein [Bradyrhizobium sp. CB1650]|uniref:ABC transporter ATP-binding protein n=1 Tax=Bradyrhizobium sp. CB1650 TaxID=3039153 RepID=UPI0024350877|nr:ABC transporter ATP-binding protein [Bradyrhizobium sp. CB1650]WGD55356.1 ABC transporter ATP-binding protein [Bradyrhizobium sp. CB1650]